MLIVWCISGAKCVSFKKHYFSKRLASSCLDTSTPFMTFSTDTARPELTWDLMNDVECVEVTEGWSSQDAVAEVQVVDVHHTQVQELEEDTGESVSGFGLRNFFIFSSLLSTHLCDLDVLLLRKLWNQEVLFTTVFLLSFHLSVQLQPGDGRLRTEVPVQCLEDEEENVEVETQM